MDSPRRARLRRPRPQRRRRPPAGRPRCDLARLGRDLPADRRAGLGRPRRTGWTRIARHWSSTRSSCRWLPCPRSCFARLVVERRAALLVAAGAVLVPTMALTGSVMTENAAYPLFLTALWLMARAVRSPTLPAQGAALGVPRPPRADARAGRSPRAGVRRGSRHVRDPARRAVEADVPPAVHADRHGAGGRPPRSRDDLRCRVGRGGARRALGGGRRRRVSPTYRASSACSWVDCS